MGGGVEKIADTCCIGNFSYFCSAAYSALFRQTALKNVPRLLGHKSVETTMTSTQVYRSMANVPNSPPSVLHGIMAGGAAAASR